MGPFAMMAVVLEVIFWMALLSVAAIFLGALAKGMIEDIRDHRRIVAARAALGRPAAGWDRGVRRDSAHHIGP